MTTTHLYIIRHGEALSAAQRMMGNTRLSPLGVKQAERLRNRLAGTKEIKADVLISSTMLRARHTAEIVAPALGLPIQFDEEIEEHRDGEGEKLSTKEFQKLFNAVSFEDMPFTQVTAGGESRLEFIVRASHALHRITHEYEGKTIVLVCHGGIVDVSFLLFIGIDTFHFPNALFNTHNTSITHWYKATLDWLPPPPRWVLERYNDVMHLRDLNTEGRIPWHELAEQPVTGRDASRGPEEAQ